MKFFYLFLLAGLLSVTAVSAQSGKQVSWNYSVKKVGDKTYEVHLSASINGKWHLYAQNAGIEGPLPTSFVFQKNPLINIEGKINEKGNLIHKQEEVWGGVVNFYEKAVDFIQVVKLKANIKTSLAGSVDFMVCNDNECLAPSTVNFSVPVGG